MNRMLIAAGIAIALLGAGCAAKNGDEQAAIDRQGGGKAPEAPIGGNGSGTAESFGDLASPCGQQTASGNKAEVEPSEAGKGTDALYLGVASDRTADITPGLNKEFWDTMQAFTAWCNEQGGIAGLKVEMIDLDGKVAQVTSAMAKGCREAFAMVGGGWALDDQIFTDDAAANFHKCKMIAIPGFAVSTAFSEANGVVQPMPNPAYDKWNTWIKDLKQIDANSLDKVAVLTSSLPAIRSNAGQVLALMKASGLVGETLEISYDAIANTGFDLNAQQIVEANPTTVYFAGQPAGLVKMKNALTDAGYKGHFWAETNNYDQLLVESLSATATEKLWVRTAQHPFEEADQFPAVQKMLDIMKQYNPSGKVASLGVQTVSAFLLFAASAAKCAEKGPITRKCVYQTAKAVDNWSAGGLHAPGNPSKNQQTPCSAFLAIENGAWKRVTPPEGEDVVEKGFACTKDPVIRIDGDFGAPNIDPSRDL